MNMVEQTQLNNEIEDPIIFEDKAQNGTPRMKMDEVRMRYPRLFAKLMENFQQGKPYEVGIYSYKIQTNAQYGNTVYQNTRKGTGVRGGGAAANNQELITALNNLTTEIMHLSVLLKGREG